MNEYPLIMLSSNGVNVVAKFIGLDENNKSTIVISEPVMYGEAIDQNGKPIGSMMRPLNFFISTPKRMNVVFDMWYYLDDESSLDKKVAVSYKEELDKINAAQAGIIAPTNGDVIKLNR